jgi:hypothetical protein
MLPLLSGIVLPLLLNSMVANVSYCFLIPSLIVLIIKTWKCTVWPIQASVQTVYLYYNIFGRLINNKANKMILGSRQHQAWQWGQIGYLHKYMILSCVMLSHQTCATLLQQPFHLWDPATQTLYCQDKKAHSSSQTTPSRTNIDSKTTQRHYSFCIQLLQAESSKYGTRYSHLPRPGLRCQFRF